MRYPHHFEFDSHGGYDGMSSGYDIRSEDGSLLFTVECLCGHWFVNGRITYPHGDHDECPTAKEMAEYIVNLVKQSVQ